MSAPIKTSNEFKKKYGHEVAKYKVDHLHQIDRELSNLSKTIEIEIMPGLDDLSTVSLPQSPVPKYLFPALSKSSSVNFTTNPCLFDAGSVRYVTQLLIMLLSVIDYSAVPAKISMIYVAMLI